MVGNVPQHVHVTTLLCVQRLLRDVGEPADRFTNRQIEAAVQIEIAACGIQRVNSEAPRQVLLRRAAD